MNRRRHTIPAAYFDALFSADPDPWGFRTSDYEREKYAATLAALRPTLYGNALEVGCANGAFTRLLVGRCDRLLAMDASPVALALAREACADVANVTFLEAAAPDGLPTETFDLILVSEVLYYLVGDDVVRMADLCADRLRPGGEIVLCHWLGETDYPLSGRDATDLFEHAALQHGFQRTRLHDTVYRLDRLGRPGDAA